MVRLPSSDSNSSDADNFFKSYLNTITKSGKTKHNIDESLGMEEIEKTKPKRDRMTESSPTTKIQLTTSSSITNHKPEDIVKDE